MCETAVINRSLVRLSKSSFARRIDIVSTPLDKERSALTRLNSDLERCYDLLYDAYPSITADDYNKLRPYLIILLDTLNDLIKAYNKSDIRKWIIPGIDRLKRNYSALYEIHSDIRNFKVEIHKNERFRTIINKIATL